MLLIHVIYRLKRNPCIRVDGLKITHSELKLIFSLEIRRHFLHLWFNLTKL